MASSTDLQFILNEAGRHPLLTPEEELIHGRRIAAWVEIKDLDPSALTTAQKQTVRRGKRSFDRMFHGNLRLVISVAKRYTSMVRNLGLDDLVQEGCIGLTTAIYKFDPARGYKFSTYSYWWIRQAISRAIGNDDRSIRIPTAAFTVYKKLAQFIPEYKKEHGRMPTLEECRVAADVRTMETLKAYLNHTNSPTSLDRRAIGKDNGEANSLVDLIACDRETPWDMVELEEMSDALMDSIKKLTPLQSYVISSRWGLNGQPSRQMHQMPEIGSRDRVKHQHLLGIRVLRDVMGAAA